MRTRGGGQQCMLLLVWGALSVGSFHALQGVTSGLAVSLGLSLTGAGDMSAMNQIVALVSLPLVGCLGGATGERRLAKVLSLIAMLACLVLASATAVEVPTFVWQCSLAALAVCGVLTPVLALALLPQVAEEPARAYGLLDSLKSFAQAAIALSLGGLRERGGYPLAIAFCCALLAASAALAAGLSQCAAEADTDKPQRAESSLTSSTAESSTPDAVAGA